MEEESRRKKILSIEDNSANRKIIFDLLTLKGGYEVVEALNGEEGLLKARSEKPDVILTDIQLPLMDGLKVTKALRSDPDPAVNKIPIVVLTSYAMPGDAEKGYAAGCNAYMVKPINLKELLDIIAKLLGEAK